MATISIRNSMIGGGISINDSRTITADNVINASESVAAGVAGTAGAAGVMTMPSGHGFTDGQVVCVSGTFGKYYNGTVSSAGATEITVSGGAGDSLPTSGAVIVSLKSEIDFAFLGTNLAALSIGGDIALVAVLEDAGGVELAVQTVANGAYSWDSGNGVTNPVTGDSIIKASVYSVGATAGTCNIIAAYNND